MGKYIRTKDKIYEVEDEIFVPASLGLPFEYLYKTVNSNILINKDNVIQQADTIDELCDRFIAETEDNTKYWVEHTLENAKMYCGIKNIYGAIWVIDDKGVPTLKPVAKMNEKGDLELI